jgi:anti-sigma B factor antagonist
MTKNIIKSIDHKDQAVIFVLEGEIDMSNSTVLRNKLLELFKDPPQILVIDMTSVTYMDSSGLGTLVEALKWSQRKNTKLRLAGITDHVLKVFEISRLSPIFEFFSNAEDALSQ